MKNPFHPFPDNLRAAVSGAPFSTGSSLFRPSCPPARRGPWGQWRQAGLLCLLVLAAGLTGCSWSPGPEYDTPPPAPPEQVVWDYGNGWYHKANGYQSIQRIAETYQRNPELVAQLNRTTALAAPAEGAMIYIPPSNDRALVRKVLVKIQAHPELIPRTPWRDPAAPPPVQAAAPAESAKVASAAAAEEPAKPHKKKGWFHWLWGGHDDEEKDAASAPGQARHASILRKSVFKSSSSRFVWPVKGQIVEPFKDGWQGGAHHGIAIAAADGTPVQASRAGKVLIAGVLPGYGNMVMIDHGDGFVTTYAYNERIWVKGGDTVKVGQRIASVGRPSQGASSKLFFQIRRNQIPVDPLKYLN